MNLHLKNLESHAKCSKIIRACLRWWRYHAHGLVVIGHSEKNEWINVSTNAIVFSIHTMVLHVLLDLQKGGHFRYMAPSTGSSCHRIKNAIKNEMVKILCAAKIYLVTKYCDILWWKYFSLKTKLISPKPSLDFI